jgi:quercetin dioxygenase-like cupin family protein
MPTFRWSELKHERVEGEHAPVSAPVVRGEQIQAARVLYPAGTEVKRHASPHEQVHAILRGRARYGVGAEQKVVGPGEAVLIAPETEYEIHALEDVEVVAFGDVQGGPDATPQPGTPGVFFAWRELASDFITPKYSSGRGPTITGRRIEVAYMFYPTGTEGKPHSHPNEQIQVALAGTVRGMIGGQAAEFGAGEGVLFPPGVEHGARIVEDYTTLNCKNIVPGWSVYHARWER